MDYIQRPKYRYNPSTPCDAKAKAAESAEALSKSAGPVGSLAAPNGSGWVRVEDGLPQHMERVLATYVGVYGHRLVTYWWDGHRGRFGLPTEADERGPQPATHWHRLPPLPNTEMRNAPRTDGK